MYATLYVTVQSKVYSWLDKLVIYKLNKAAIDSSSVVSPAKNLIPESMMVECVVPTTASSSFRISPANSWCSPTSYTRNLPCGGTTNGQLIADLIAKRGRQIRVPWEHSPRPEFRRQHDDFKSTSCCCSKTTKSQIGSYRPWCWTPNRSIALQEQVGINLAFDQHSVLLNEQSSQRLKSCQRGNGVSSASLCSALSSHLSDRMNDISTTAML